MLPIDLNEKFSLFTDHWHPRIVGELNGQLVKLAKGLGSLAMHHHAGEDEMFLIHKGELTLKFADDTSVTIGAGQFYIVPRGVDHQPIAEQEVEIVLFEPASTAHTGNVTVEATRMVLDRI
ncbi:MAG: cupin domain-containing protein [Saprospiraceae bacterium]